MAGPARAEFGAGEEGVFRSWKPVLGSWTGSGETGGVPVQVNLEVGLMFGGPFLQLIYTFAERSGRTRKQLWIYQVTPAGPLRQPIPR